MKIICENCSAKYSIADEKVQGKVFKIRCKKCGESIVVRGDSQQTGEAASLAASQSQPASEQPFEEPPPMPDEPGEEEGDAETRVFDYSGYQSSEQDPAIWHIVVDGQQQGPYTGAQIRQFLDTGSLDAESFIWKEGFDDWMPIKNVPELGWAGGTKPRAEVPAQDSSGGGIFDQPAASQGGGLFDQPVSGGIFGQEQRSAVGVAASPFDGSAGLFGGDVGAGADSSGDVFSSAVAPASTGGMFNADTTMEPESAGIFGDAGGGGHDLFGDGGGEGGGLFGGSDQPAGSPRVSAAQAMTGQRNENSVLFSLSNLQALAATPSASDGGGGGMFSSAGRAVSPAAAPVPGEEASGLIDIRSLAGSINAEKENTGVEDLISMGGGGFAPSLGAPVLAPQNTGLSLPIKIGIIAGGVFVAALIVVLIVMVMKGSDGDSGQLREAEIEELKKQLLEMRATGGSSQQIENIQSQIAQKEQQQSNTRMAAAVAQKVSDDSTEEGLDESEDAKKAGKRSGAPGKRTTGPAAAGARPKPASGGISGTPKSTASAEPAPTGGGAAPKRRGGADELDDLLGGSLSKPKKAPAAAPSGGEGGGGGGGGGTGKKSLDRNDVQNGMNSVANGVKACGQGQSGTVTLKVVIGRTGRVMSANATGPFAGTPVGSCAARAVRSARFPASDANLTVHYPFRL